MYRYKIERISFMNDSEFVPGKINVFVGANNCGKTQLLKDIRAFITGNATPRIIAKEIEVTYPESWEDMKSAYDMQVVGVQHNQSKQLRHVSPTLDESPSGQISPEIEKLLASWLNQADKQQFRLATGAGLVTYLNTDNRLKLALSKPVVNLHETGAKNVLEALYLSGKDSVEKVRLIVHSIFKTDIHLDVSNLGMLQYKVGHDFTKISNDPQVAFSQLATYGCLDEQGDGLRSAVGIIGALVGLKKKPVILLDEPEAFLHPPQAEQLGAAISDIVDDSQQIFISTHSADFLRGLLRVNRHSVIVHVKRNENDETKLNALDENDLNEIITSPLLSSSRVLEGMFYKGVVITEADADAVFYQRLFQKIGSSDEIHFINAHNKQTLVKVIQPFLKMQIRAAMIADADVIRDVHEFKTIISAISTDEKQKTILEQREAIYNFFESQSKYAKLCDLREKMFSLASRITLSSEDDQNKMASALFDLRKELKKMRDDSDALAEFKQKGRASLPLEKQQAFDNLWSNCSENGLFIVPVGELESWLTEDGLERTNNKSKWISSALSKVFDLNYDPDKEIWQFIDSLRGYLID